MLTYSRRMVDDHIQNEIDDLRNFIRKVEREGQRFMWSAILAPSVLGWWFHDVLSFPEKMTLFGATSGPLFVLHYLCLMRVDALKSELREIRSRYVPREF